MLWWFVIGPIIATNAIFVEEITVLTNSDKIIFFAWLSLYVLVFVPLIYGLIKSRKLKLALIESKQKLNPQVRTNRADSEGLDESSALGTENKLKELKDLYDRRLISKKIYEEKQKELIAQL